ncbi:hypothetical protein ACIPLC_29710 [Kitasatospora sp. NPDC086801]|uniref:hypothetical protein n=1 Tax=Kitasatospora sp. NPDC086801 TaxID=3364066 RepID=UPI003829D954
MKLTQRISAVALATATLAGGMTAMATSASAETSTNGGGLSVTSINNGYDAYYAASTSSTVRFKLECRDNTFRWDQGYFNAAAGSGYSYFFNVGSGKGCRVQLINTAGNIITQTGFVA